MPRRGWRDLHVTAIELPTWRGRPDDAARALAAIDDWVANAALAELVGAFGGSTAGRREAELLAYLDGFSAEHWDLRSGRERNLADAAAFAPDQDALILAAAAQLGLAGIERPEHARYDTVLMTGGMIRAGIVKPRFVAELFDSGLTADRVVFLGGFRPFAGDELELAERLGVKGDNEVAAMVAGMELAFGPLEEPRVTEIVAENQNASWREYMWLTPQTRLSVVAAPSSEPERRRANTADTFRFWAEHRRASTERSVLVVTTPIYVPYQGAAAVEILGLGYGLAVETIGVSAGASDLGEYSQPFLPGHHLQELRSAIRGMRSLRALLSH